MLIIEYIFKQSP